MKKFVLLIVCLSAIPFLTFLLVYKLGLQEDVNHFKNSINDISSLIDHSKWEEAEKEVKEIHKSTEKNQWKFDLVGTPIDYAVLIGEIAKLEASVKAKDKLQSRIEVSAVRALGKHIFS
jgi:hypothetical protein